MIFSLPFGNCKDLPAMKERKIKPKQKANMLSLDCVGEILASLKSTEMLTFISPWTGNWKQVQYSIWTQCEEFKDGWTAFD